MKVLHLTNSLATGGAEKLLADSIPLYAEHGIDAKLLLLSGAEYPFLTKLKATHPNLVASLSGGSVYSPMHVLRLVKYLKAYDIVHVHLFPSLYWAAIAKMLSFSNVKLVFTEHNTHNRRREKPLFKILDKIIYKSYSAITCITRETLELLAAHISSSSKLMLIENGIDLEAITNAAPAKRSQIHPSISDGDKLIVMVAGFRAQKDQPSAIKAMQNLPADVKLLLVGDGVLRAECEALAKSLDLEGRVLFLGIRSDVPNILKACDVAALSSHWEGFGLAAVESMAAGIPFVASNVPGLSDVVADAGILVEKNNPKAISDAVSQLLSDSELYAETAAKCKARAQKYDIKNMVSSFASLYKSLKRG